MMAGTFYSMKSLSAWGWGIALLLAAIFYVVFRWTPSGSRNVAIIGATVLVAVLAFGGLMLRDQMRRSTFERLKQNGLRGTAFIARADPTFFFINRRRQMSVTFELRVPGREPRSVDLLGSPPFGYPIGQGQLVTLYADRDDPDTWVIDWETPPPGVEAAPAQMPAAPAGARAVSDRLAELERLREAGQLSEDEYRAQRQRILADL